MRLTAVRAVRQLRLLARAVAPFGAMLFALQQGKFDQSPDFIFLQKNLLREKM